MTQSPAALILAAGEGRRFGQPKALVRLDDELLVDRSLSLDFVGTRLHGGNLPNVLINSRPPNKTTRPRALSIRWRTL